MKILIVDDLVTNVSILRITLSQVGHTVVTARDGNEAIAILKLEPIDMVLTDWMMPNLDGISLIRWIRSSLPSRPGIIVITALKSAEAEVQAIEAGADAFLVKPYSHAHLKTLLTDIHAKTKSSLEQTIPVSHKAAPMPVAAPNFCAVSFGAGTGGAMGVRKIFDAMGSVPNAAFFIVLHGPGWAAEALAEQMRVRFASCVVIPKDGEKVRPGTIYIASGDAHMTILPEDMTVRYLNTPPENFHRPSIDPLFRSAAEVFGRRAIGVVLAGTGVDGYIGAGHIQVAHGMVIVQEPSSSAASSQMSQNVISLGLATRVLPLEKIGSEILEQIQRYRDGRINTPMTDTVEGRK